VRILIDGAIIKPELGGIATYTAGVASGLALQDGVEVCVATSVPELFDFDGIQILELPPSVRDVAARVAWRERSLHALARATCADVLFAPTIELPLARRPPRPTIAVVHDIGPIVAPELYGGRRRGLRYALAAQLACRRAAHIICVSTATLDMLRRQIRTIRAPCSVVGEAGRNLPVLPRQPRTRPFVLSVGAALPHKNLETLITAMNSDALLDVGLELAGPLSESEGTQVDSWRLSVRAPERIVHHGFVGPQALAQLYASAAIVAVPSRSEGFGLPLLEGMRAGAPVIASALPALRELGEQAALYVTDPLDAHEWATALSGLLEDERRASELSSAGRERAARFTWPEIGSRIAHIATALARPGDSPGTRANR
jgi:glycosyltransferase involved in cell wall biosynthesis